jgi:hypothetical protein
MEFWQAELFSLFFYGQVMRVGMNVKILSTKSHKKTTGSITEKVQRPVLVVSTWRMLLQPTIGVDGADFLISF